MNILRSIASASLLCATTASAQQTVINFDNISSLTDYAAHGLTFSPNIVHWGPQACSVLSNPSCGSYSTPYGICAGNCGGQGPGYISLPR